MTKRGSGRGQEEFTGDFARVLDAVQREKERRLREAYGGARQGPRTSPPYTHAPDPGPAPGGPLRPHRARWRVLRVRPERRSKRDRNKPAEEVIAAGTSRVMLRSAWKAERKVFRQVMKQVRFEIPGEFVKLR